MANRLSTFLDQVYRVDTDEAAWLDGVGAEVMRHIPNEGAGAFWSYRLTGPLPELTTVRITAGDDEWLGRLVSGYTGSLQPEDAARLYVGAPYGRITEHLGTANAANKVFAQLAPGRLDDAFGLAGWVPLSSRFGIQGVIIACPITQALPASKRRLHASLVAHLERGLAARALLRDEAEAIEIDPEGRILRGEVRRDERSGLRDATRRFDRARARLDQGEEQRAREHFEALCSGEWHVVESYAERGRRHFLCIRRPGASADRRLSDKERAALWLTARGASNQEIAFELGISATAAANHLARGLRTLQIPDRMTLTRLFG